MSGKNQKPEPAPSNNTTPAATLQPPPSPLPSPVSQPAPSRSAVSTPSPRPSSPSRVALSIKHGEETPLGECPTSLDLSIPKHKAMAFAAANPSDYEFGRSSSVTVVATHWLIYPDSRVDEETGELREFAVVVLFDKEGHFFKTTSATAMKRMQAAVSLFRPADWERGIPFVISRRVGQSGRTYHDIRVLVDDEKGLV